MPRTVAIIWLSLATCLVVACGASDGGGGGGGGHRDGAPAATCADGGPCSELGQPCHAGSLYPADQVHPCDDGLVCSWQPGDLPDSGGVCCQADNPSVCVAPVDAGA